MWKLWQWLISWFVRDSFEVYKPSERLIYKYWDGGQIVHADPMVIYKRLMEVKGDLEGDLAVAESQHSDAPKCQEMALAKLRKIFDLVPLTTDGKNGLTTTETLALFDHFMTFCGRLKKNLSSTRTPAVETSAVSVTSLAKSPPTPKPSVSGSIDNGQSIEKPTLSVSGPLSLSDQSVQG